MTAVTFYMHITLCEWCNFRLSKSTANAGQRYSQRYIHFDSAVTFAFVLYVFYKHNFTFLFYSLEFTLLKGCIDLYVCYCNNSTDHSKSRECKSDFFEGHASRPYKRTGMHLLLINCKMTSHDDMNNHVLVQ